MFDKMVYVFELWYINDLIKCINNYYLFYLISVSKKYPHLKYFNY